MGRRRGARARCGIEPVAVRELGPPLVEMLLPQHCRRGQSHPDSAGVTRSQRGVERRQAHLRAKQRVLFGEHVRTDRSLHHHGQDTAMLFKPRLNLEHSVGGDEGIRTVTGKLVGCPVEILVDHEAAIGAKGEFRGTIGSFGFGREHADEFEGRKQ